MLALCSRELWYKDDALVVNADVVYSAARGTRDIPRLAELEVLQHGKTRGSERGTSMEERAREYGTYGTFPTRGNVQRTRKSDKHDSTTHILSFELQRSRHSVALALNPTAPTKKRPLNTTAAPPHHYSSTTTPLQ